MKILSEIENLEIKIAETYKDYKRKHPGTKKLPSDPLFTKPSHLFVGTCKDIGKKNCPLTRAGDASKWDRMTTEESAPISKQEFFSHVGDEHKGLADKAVGFGKHPQHKFVWAEVPHKDGKGTVHHYFFRD